MDRSLRNALVGEFLGTFLFVTIGAGAIVTQTFQGADNSGLVGVALAHALALGVLISAFAGISGGHLNPAVTIGVLTAGKIKAAPAAMYIVVQLVAAVLAGYFLRFVYPEAIWQPTNLGVPALGTDVTPTLGIAIEFVMTLVLVLVVFGTAVDARGPKLGGLAIGLAVGADILFGGPLTGAAMNVARWFGPAVASGDFSNWYVWIVGPLLAGLAVGALWRYVMAERETRPSRRGPEANIAVGSATRRLRLRGPLDLGATLAPLRHGIQDPTIRLRGRAEILRATLTPEGPDDRAPAPARRRGRGPGLGAGRRMGARARTRPHRRARRSDDLPA